MTLLVVSPDYASHYGPLAVVARAVSASGRRVIVATGSAMRPQVTADGFEWKSLLLGPGSNDGVVADAPGVRRFIDATRAGPVATLRRQALDREMDLLWEPERVARRIADLVVDVAPGEVLVDHVSFASTLAMYALGRSFVTLTPGHPSQLPLSGERYGIPSHWPSSVRPDRAHLAELEMIADRVTVAFTERWNAALAEIAPDRSPVENAFRVHGRRVLYNSVEQLHDPVRGGHLPADHRFVGPLVRHETLGHVEPSWLDRLDDRPHVYVSLGTFLSHRHDVLRTIAESLRRVGAHAAIAVGPNPPESLGHIPQGWIVARHLPQVALLSGADLAIHHGGNNSVQEALAAGTRQIVLPFSTDQFATAADLERIGFATVLPPNDTDADGFGTALEAMILAPPPEPVASCQPSQLVDAVFS